MPQLILFMHRMLLQFEKQDNDIPALCIHILKGMGAKLKGDNARTYFKRLFSEDNIIFPNETTSFLLKEFSRDAWWFRYAITEWFSYSMNNPPKEVMLHFLLTIKFRSQVVFSMPLQRNIVQIGKS